ncbi:MAG: carbonic anhydrase [Deltaproteobacteria bacterium]|nr:carbonic anhydrase [Deltaproteobacteria bacterium]
MRQLIDGIHRFQAGVFGPQQELFRRLVDGQAPDALFITCSDSRVAPNLITQTKPGELFIVRNAGNLIPPWGQDNGVTATIEYALECLDVSDVIVCGHTHCGAMTAVLHPDKVAKLPAMRQWLTFAEGTRRVIARHYPNLDPDALEDVCVEENVLCQIENLRTHPSVMAKLAANELTLHAWVYDIESGGVHAFSDAKGQFVPVTEAGQGVSARGLRAGRIRDI